MILPDQSQIRYGNYQWLTATRIETPGATKTISVDALQRPLSIEVKNAAAELLASRHYQYDKAGNITQIESDLGTTEYGYDPLDRLTKAVPDQQLKDLGLPTEQYQYDAVHNRVFSDHQVGRWSYNADNQLTSYPRLRPFDKVAKPIQIQVEYTPQGHTARESSDKGERSYSYNAAERLTRYASTAAGQSTPDIDAQYRYDPLGRRVSKELKEGQTTKVIYFFYSDTGLLGETNEQGQMTRAYAFDSQKSEQGLWSTDPIWQVDVIAAKLTNGNSIAHYLHTDHLGTPVLGTSKQGEATWKAVAEAFGSTGTLKQGQIEMNLRFPGQYFESSSGDGQNYHGDYRFDIGRYSQRDPIELDGGVNQYIYAAGNPARFVDTLGLQISRPRPGLPNPWLPQPVPVDPSEPYGPTWVPPIDFPDFLKWPKKSYSCQVVCNVQQIDPCADCPERVSGSASANTKDGACKAAQKDANSRVPRGCYKRHCHEVR